MSRRQPYTRHSTPPPMRLTERDGLILETIYTCDGVLSLKQIDRLFFSGKGRSQPRARMRLLFDHGYVSMPNANEIHQVPLGETIFWLAQRGAKVVAARLNVSAKRLRWRRKPRWSWLAHDLRVNDIRLCVQTACNLVTDLKLTHWVPETNFLKDPDKVTYTNRRGVEKHRQIRPDGFALIEQEPGKRQYAFLLEVDMASHSNPRFAREKVLAGTAYLQSEAYQQRFGLRYGRWLIVTTSQARLQNLKRTAEHWGGEGLFYFSTFEALQATTVLREEIWYRAGDDAPMALIPNSA